LQALLQTMRKNNVNHSLILAEISPIVGSKPMNHEDILKLIEPYPQLHLVGKVPLKFSRNAGYLKKVRKHVEAREMLGIKLYPGYEPFYPHDNRFDKVYDMCEEFEIPVMLHSGDIMEKGYLKYAMPLHVDELASGRPDLKIIICHMGNPWQLDTAAVTSKNVNVYADTSGLFDKKLDRGMKIFLQHRIEEFISWNAKSEKLIFGSDWPITDVKDTIDLINGLHITRKDKKLIFSDNAKNLVLLKLIIFHVNF